MKISKHEFVQHTTKYLSLQPELHIKPIKSGSIEQLRECLGEYKILEGDINDPILPGFDEW